MLIPYRVKNPVKHFPVATLALIIVNVIVYALTTDYMLVIKESIAREYAFTLGVSGVANFISSIFLHADPLHLIGNMLFLWVFGGPVEDRVGIPRYLALYFAAGLVGSLLQGGFESVFTGVVRPGIGASGCIMGVVGAYWYLYSWSTVCVFYWFWWFWHGVWEIQAIWVIGVYLVMDLAEGLFMGSGGGVADFAHVGGGVAGVLFCMAMRMKRDTEEVSEAKAMHADQRDFAAMPLSALRTMMSDDPENLELLRAMIVPAVRAGQFDAIHEAMQRLGPLLIDRDPELAAYCLVDLHGDPSVYQPVQLLRLGGLLERRGDPKNAVAIYRMIVGSQTDTVAETALYRLALCSWNSFGDSALARGYLAEMERRFPVGEMAAFRKALLHRLP